MWKALCFRIDLHLWMNDIKLAFWTISKSVDFYWCCDIIITFCGANNIEELVLVLFLKYSLPHVSLILILFIIYQKTVRIESKKSSMALLSKWRQLLLYFSSQLPILTWNVLLQSDQCRFHCLATLTNACMLWVILRKLCLSDEHSLLHYWDYQCSRIWPEVLLSRVSFSSFPMVVAGKCWNNASK
jgi:hypothetical protein